MSNKPIEILGKTFASEAEAQAWYKDDLRKRLPELKKLEGFPIGDDEDIINLSNPPFYTACPNPYINEFIEKYGKPYNEETDDYHRDPFVGDVSEGKSDVIYTAHGYHTKVPYKAIMKYIDHYTDNGDLVLDGFSGTGMTGVAAQSLGRKSILSDLSPFATFISYVYNSHVDAGVFEKEAKELLLEVEKECGWMYKTNHPKEENYVNQSVIFKEVEKKGTINFTVWSDVFVCPFCKNEYTFFREAFDHETNSVKKEYNCPSCQAVLTKKDCERAFVSYNDEILGEIISQAKQVPVLINYSYQNEIYSKIPDENDLALIEKINSLQVPYWFPTIRMPDGDESRRNDKMGLTHVHHFFSKRSIYTLAYLFNKLNLKNNVNKHYLRFTFQQAILGFAKISRYVPSHFSQVNQYLSGTLYIGSQIVEVSLPYIIKGKISRLIKAFAVLNNNRAGNSFTTTQSATSLQNVKSDSVDYIFTDPPFGDNLMYSELNFFHESWNKIYTNNNSEAIINKTQDKDLAKYQILMLNSFKEYY